MSRPAARRVDNLTLTATTDFAALVREVLLGGGGVGSLPSDCFPVDWVFRAYGELHGTPFGDLLSRGVAACLTAPEPDVRAQALMFFQSQPEAAGSERVDALLTGDRALFAGVTAPMFPGADLEWHVRAASSARARRLTRTFGSAPAASSSRTAPAWDASPAACNGAYPMPFG